MAPIFCRTGVPWNASADNIFGSYKILIPKRSGFPRREEAAIPEPGNKMSVAGWLIDLNQLQGLIKEFDGFGGVTDPEPGFE